ncbi:ABC transporter substrate-binding protein [Aestuariivita sp.]|jgi:putative spermidine/putrescine transport system substrate-binding protein|uniref:ABC transporter substrate-binding protein n=1 Tax=Aestuariivita sp. TaxID=1872407 RepID=UPI00216EE8F4|nr:ABC transporter substrate-binding protein [Aestuariivita sp.]MCE8006923.1 ABC transporter substrate-binding protein [Aestuariivita sp.]
MNDEIQNDNLERLADQARSGQITRRRFTQLAIALLGTTALATKGTPVLADDGQLVFVNWGGDATTAYDSAFGQPFEAETGVAIRQDGSGPTEGAIQAQIQSGNPAWDIVDADPFSAEALGKRGMMEPIDYDVVDRGKMRDGFGWDYAASTYFFSYVIAYDATRFGDTPPTGMADFFDTERFPGKRAMYKWGVGMWEALLLGDGVARADLYPLDIDRAHEKLRAFKDDVIAFWGGGAESQSLLLNGDASMALVWSTRAKLLEQDSEGDIRFIWNDGMISPGSMGVLKDNPGGAENAMRFIASAQDPERQKVLFDLLGTGPANPAADTLIPEDQRRFNPVDPANFALQAPLDMAWYEEHYGAALDTYLGIVSA